MNKKSSASSLRERAEMLGIGILWDELFRPGSPLAFLTAQGLRVASPVLGAFTSPARLSALHTLADNLEAAEPPETESADAT